MRRRYTANIVNMVLYHLCSFIRYLTRPGYSLRRLYLYAERKLFKHSRVLCGPVWVKLNTGYKCNLRCPLCPTGRREPANSHELTIDDVLFLLPRLGKAYYFSLFGWGEPFLNRDIFGIISVLKEFGKSVGIDSNLNISRQQTIDKLENSPIDFLSVSLDGVDQDSYTQYCYGGSFDLVLRNIKRLLAAREGPKRIEWQYLASKKNIQFIRRAKQMSKEIGVPICFKDIGMYLDMFYVNSSELEQEWLTNEQISRLKNFSKRGQTCMYMYNDPFIDPDGRVYPCCNAARAPAVLLQAGYQNVFGNLHENTLWEIWNNEYYQCMRSLFAGHRYNGREVKPICLMCKVYFDSRGMNLGWRPVFNGDTARINSVQHNAT